METPASRRGRGIRIWMQGQFALGKTAGELVEHAQRHDPATARLLAEVAAELDEAA